MLYLSVQIWFWIALAAAIGIVVGVRLQRQGVGQTVATPEQAAGEAAAMLERELNAAREDAADALAYAETMKADMTELEARLAEAARAVPEAEAVRLRERIALLERDLEAALPADDRAADETEEPEAAEASYEDDDVDADEPAPAVAAFDEAEEAETVAAEDDDVAESEGEAEDGPLPAYGLAAPRGAADDLRRISGIGTKLQEKLNAIGVFHYSQIAGFGADDVAWVDEQLKTRGRIVREDWPGQAAALLRGRADAA